MTKNWLVEGISIAREIKASGLHSKHKVQANGANSECSRCICGNDNCNESNKWLGLPSGVKFDPSDIEVLGHLAAKRGIGSAKAQPYIDVFIPTLYDEEGICSKHPQDLPGSRTDGNTFHFFSRTTKAYTTGQRKRRKINNESSSTLNVRWRKTGQTKPIFKNGARIGFKKILVLYETVVGGSKARKLDWVMHQYHIGPDEEEKDGEYVVSKMFYQVQKQIKNSDVRVVGKESDVCTSLTTPGTPMTNAPDPPRPGNTPVFEDDTCYYVPQPKTEKSEYSEQKYLPSFSGVELHNNGEEDLQAIDLDTSDNSFLRKDNESTIHIARPTSDTSLGTTVTENLDFGSPFDFNLADLYFPPEDSFNGWLDPL